jgi:hypothetical protein
MATAVAGLLLSTRAVARAEAPDGDTSDAGQASSPAPAKQGGPSNWQIDSTGYLWLSGAHGNLSALDYNLGFKASAGDLLSSARFGITEIVDVRWKLLVLTEDVLYMALTGGQSRVVPLPNISPVISATYVNRDVIFTQKVGYRMIDSAKVKIDAMTGFRFWHLGNTLTITPRPLGNNNNLYTSRNWTDPMVGARVLIPLSPKIMATIAGDVGGWGAGSQMDYQIVGALSYKIKPKLTLDAAWRYLYLDYGQYPFGTQLALSGPVLGVTYSWKRTE